MSKQTEKMTFMDFLNVSCEAPFLKKVPYETKKVQMERFAELLLLWSEKMNLVASSTLPFMWDRHFLDSAQLVKQIPSNTQSLVDLGSGAGFPGLVLSILGVPEVHLVESVGKKAKFLSEVVDDLGLNITVHNKRIEAISGLKVDVVTARALTALPKLLSYAKPFMEESSKAVFLKGEKTPAELTDAKKYWTFKHKVESSLTSSLGQILIISKLKVRASHGSRSR